MRSAAINADDCSEILRAQLLVVSELMQCRRDHIENVDMVSVRLFSIFSHRCDDAAHFGMILRVSSRSHLGRMTNVDGVHHPRRHRQCRPYVW